MVDMGYDAKIARILHCVQNYNIMVIPRERWIKKTTFILICWTKYASTLNYEKRLLQIAVKFTAH